MQVAPTDLSKLDLTQKVDPEEANEMYQQIQEIKDATSAADTHKMVFTTRLYYNRARKNSLTESGIDNKRYECECALEKN